MNLIIALVLSVFAVQKITLMFMEFDGPFNTVKIFREAVTKLQTENVKALNFECFFCLSTVITIPFALYVANGPVEFVIYWFGIAGAALFLNRIYEAIY